MTGFERGPAQDDVRRMSRDMAEFPGLVEARRQRVHLSDVVAANCKGPISYQGQDALATDIANLQAALAATPARAS